MVIIVDEPDLDSDGNPTFIPGSIEVYDPAPPCR